MNELRFAAKPGRMHPFSTPDHRYGHMRIIGWKNLIIDIEPILFYSGGLCGIQKNSHIAYVLLTGLLAPEYNR